MPDDEEVWIDPLHRLDGPRPPIHTFDEPIDESGADEAEEKRAKRKAERSPVMVEALRMRDLGFTIMPLPTHAKAPPPSDWAAASKNNPGVFLKNPGTHNYAVLPPPGCFGWDVDKDAPKTLLAVGDSLAVELPPTLTTLTPNGCHQFFRWPEGVARPKGPMFGSVVTRWPFGEEGQGYLVGPGSVVTQEDGTLGTYRLGDEDAIADLPPEWAVAALEWRPARPVAPAGSGGPLAEVRQRYELPERVEAGLRYEAIRSYTASLYNRGLSSNEMWPLVQAELAPRFAVALTKAELRERFERAVRDIAANLGPPLRVVGASAGIDLTDGLFVGHDVLLADLLEREPSKWLIDGWVPGGAFVVFAGHPKSMKSLAVLQMLGAFVAGGVWLGRAVEADATRVGLYMTREGSNDEMAARIQRLEDRHGAALGSRLRVAYEKPIEFDEPSYRYVSGALAGIESEMSVMPGPLRVMLVIDPMRDFMSAGADENEAKSMAVVKRWCRSLIAEYPWLSIVLVHHLRKSGSFDELDMAGSGATFGAVDGSVMWVSNGEAGEEDEDEDGGPLVRLVEMSGKYKVRSRGRAAFKGQWRWDPDTEAVVRRVGKVVGATGKVVYGTGRKAVVEYVRGAGRAGALLGDVYRDAGAETETAKGTVRKQLSRAVEEGELETDGDRYYGAGMEPEEGGLGLG